MSKASILEKLKTRTRVEKVKFLDEDVNIRVLTISEMGSLDLNDKDDKQLASFLSKQFLDIDSGEELFKPSDIIDYMTNREALKMIKLFMSVNASTEESAELFEKN